MTNSARALVVSHRFPFPPHKGEKIRTYHQITYLLDLGFTVDLYSLSDQAQDQNHSKELSQKHGVESKLFPVASGLLRYLKYLQALATKRSFTESYFHSKELHKTLKALDLTAYDFILVTGSGLTPYLDSIHSNSTRANVASSTSKDDLNKPKVLVDFMDVDSDKWLQYTEKSRGLKRWIFSREAKAVLALEARAIDRSTASFLISSNEVERFCELHKVDADTSKTRAPVVLGNGVSFDDFPALTFRSIHKDDPPHFVFMGVMDYLPNQDAAIFFVRSILPIIQQQHASARFTIVGMNPSSEVLALASEAGVEVTGMVDSVGPYLAKAHIFVAPFRVARGVQNKVLQAMASELPVVSTPLGNEGINAPAIQYQDSDSPTHGQTPAIAIAENAPAFAQACIDLIDDEPLRRSLAIRGCAFVKRTFSWESQLAPLKSHIALQQATRNDHSKVASGSN